MLEQLQSFSSPSSCRCRSDYRSMLPGRRVMLLSLLALPASPRRFLSHAHLWLFSAASCEVAILVFSISLVVAQVQQSLAFILLTIIHFLSCLLRSIIRRRTCHMRVFFLLVTSGNPAQSVSQHAGFPSLLP